MGAPVLPDRLCRAVFFMSLHASIDRLKIPNRHGLSDTSPKKTYVHLAQIGIAHLLNDTFVQLIHPPDFFLGA